MSTLTAFPHTGIPSTEVTREPGHTGMADHGSDITKELLQGVNDRVQEMNQEASGDQHPNPSGWMDTGAEKKRRTLQTRDATNEGIDGGQREVRSHSFVALFVGIAFGVLLGRATK